MRRFIDSGNVVTTAGVSAGIDGALHVVARLLGRAIADRTARYMEYHWTPEPYLAPGYSLLNPSTDDRGRKLQQGENLEAEKSWAEAVAIYRTLIAHDQADAAAWYRLHIALHNSGDYAAAIDAGQHAVAFPQFSADALVNLACSYAKAGKREEALSTLQRAAEAGFKAAWRLQDDDLKSLREDERFQRIVAAVEHPRA